MNHLPARAATDVVAAPTTDPAPALDPAFPPRAHLVAVPSLPALAATPTDEEGSLVAEYGLLAVVAATVAGALIVWARGDALTQFFSALLNHARSLVVG